MNNVKVKPDNITKIFKVMSKNSSRKTGKVSINIKGIAEKTKLSTRTVDRALAQMRASKQIKTPMAGVNYVK
jgi:CTP-dependent riboflavin kinase